MIFFLFSFFLYKADDIKNDALTKNRHFFHFLFSEHATIDHQRSKFTIKKLEFQGISKNKTHTRKKTTFDFLSNKIKKQRKIQDTKTFYY